MSRPVRGMTTLSWLIGQKGNGWTISVRALEGKGGLWVGDSCICPSRMHRNRRDAASYYYCDTSMGPIGLKLTGHQVRLMAGTAHGGQVGCNIVIVKKRRQVSLACQVSRCPVTPMCDAVQICWTRGITARRHSRRRSSISVYSSPAPDYPLLSSSHQV